jgi:hypothetical protein
MILQRLSAALRTAREALRLSPWTSGALNPIHCHFSQRQRERCRSQHFHSVRWTTTRSLALVTCICTFAPMTVLAWLYPEHRSITFLAIKMLEPEQRSQLDALWSETRRGHESRLCAQMADTRQGQHLPVLTSLSGLPSQAITPVPPRKCFATCLLPHGFLRWQQLVKDSM